MSVYVDVFATHFLETSIWTAKSTTKIKAMQLIDWCKPFTSEKRNWNTNTPIIDKHFRNNSFADSMHACLRSSVHMGVICLDQ